MKTKTFGGAGRGRGRGGREEGEGKEDGQWDKWAIIIASGTDSLVVFVSAGSDVARLSQSANHSFADSCTFRPCAF